VLTTQHINPAHTATNAISILPSLAAPPLPIILARQMIRPPIDLPP